MHDKVLLIFMDVLVLVALAGTMYFMRNISSGIRIIREGKTDLQQLLQQLNVHISNANHAIENMQKLSDDKARQLQKQTDNASSVIDELQFIQRAADNVAQRLEKLTGQAAAGNAAAKEEIQRNTAQNSSQASRPAATRSMSKAEKELSDAMAARRSKATGE